MSYYNKKHGFNVILEDFLNLKFVPFRSTNKDNCFNISVSNISNEYQTCSINFYNENSKYKNLRGSISVNINSGYMQNSKIEELYLTNSSYYIVKKENNIIREGVLEEITFYNSYDLKEKFTFSKWYRY